MSIPGFWWRSWAAKNQREGGELSETHFREENLEKGSLAGEEGALLIL